MSQSHLKTKRSCSAPFKVPASNFNSPFATSSEADQSPCLPQLARTSDILSGLSQEQRSIAKKGQEIVRSVQEPWSLSVNLQLTSSQDVALRKMVGQEIKKAYKRRKETSHSSPPLKGPSNSVEDHVAPKVRKQVSSSQMQESSHKSPKPKAGCHDEPLDGVEDDVTHRVRKHVSSQVQDTSHRSPQLKAGCSDEPLDGFEDDGIPKVRKQATSSQVRKTSHRSPQPKAGCSDGPLDGVEDDVIPKVRKQATSSEVQKTSHPSPKPKAAGSRRASNTVEDDITHKVRKQASSSQVQETRHRSPQLKAGCSRRALNSNENDVTHRVRKQASSSQVQETSHRFPQLKAGCSRRASNSNENDVTHRVRKQASSSQVQETSHRSPQAKAGCSDEPLDGVEDDVIPKVRKQATSSQVQKTSHPSPKSKAGCSRRALNSNEDDVTHRVRKQASSSQIQETSHHSPKPKAGGSRRASNTVEDDITHKVRKQASSSQVQETSHRSPQLKAGCSRKASNSSENDVTHRVRKQASSSQVQETSHRSPQPKAGYNGEPWNSVEYGVTYRVRKQAPSSHVAISASYNSKSPVYKFKPRKNLKKCFHCPSKQGDNSEPKSLAHSEKVLSKPKSAAPQPRNKHHTVAKSYQEQPRDNQPKSSKSTLHQPKHTTQCGKSGHHQKQCKSLQTPCPPSHHSGCECGPPSSWTPPCRTSFTGMFGTGASPTSPGGTFGTGAPPRSPGGASVCSSFFCWDTLRQQHTSTPSYQRPEGCGSEPTAATPGRSGTNPDLPNTGSTVLPPDGNENLHGQALSEYEFPLSPSSERHIMKRKLKKNKSVIRRVLAVIRQCRAEMEAIHARRRELLTSRDPGQSGSRTRGSHGLLRNKQPAAGMSGRGVVSRPVYTQ